MTHADYEATPEFQAYLVAKAKWEKAHGDYILGGGGNRLHRRLNRTRQEMMFLLTKCRETEEHKQVFGW